MSRKYENDRPADIAVIIVDEDHWKPAVLVVKASPESGLTPGDAYEREHWSFGRDADGEWDVR